MELEINHTSSYSYECPVVLEAHYLRFKPLRRPNIVVKEFDLQISPTPVKLTERLDAENNNYHQAWLNDEPTRRFDIEAGIRLTSHPCNPFDFLMDPDIFPSQEDFYYSDKQSDFLKPYLNSEAHPALSAFTGQVAEQSGDKMVPFLSLMVQKIYDDWEYEKRYEDRELDAGKCFDQKKGSCKDLAWMLMMMLRGAGLATRFVSGYAYNPDVDFRHELHAWVEVLLPGAGWVGMDPSAGLFADENYVPVATSFDPALTMPVDGNYRGNCGSSLETDVNITILD